MGAPCKHEPIRARPGKAFDKSQDCPFCHHWLHSAAHHRLWGGDGAVYQVPSDPPVLLPAQQGSTTAAAQVMQPASPSAKPFGTWAWGDFLAGALEKIGITKERVSAWLGVDCGCAERQEKWNRLGAWVRNWLLGRASREDLEKILDGQ